MSLVSTNRGDFEIFTHGEGEPLVYTHLYSEYNAYGDIMSQQLSEHYKVFIVNLRGAGQSVDCTDEYSYSMDDAIHDLEAVRISLGIDKWTFAGHSTGGFLALKYAILYPNSLIQIIAGGLCASDDYMNHSDSIYCQDNPNNVKMRDIFSKLRSSNITREEKIELSKEWIMMSLYNDDTYYELMKRKESGRTLMQKLDYFTKELANYDIRDDLRQCKTESFIYCGLHDAQCPYIFSKEAAELLPNASLETFEFSNHLPFIEEEEKFKEYIRLTVQKFI